MEGLCRRSSRSVRWEDGCWLKMESQCSGVDREESSQMGKHFVFRGLGGHERG